MANSNNEERQIRTYRLVSPAAREIYDLRQYSNIIIDTVQSIIPNVKVEVNRDSYTVYGITRGEAIQIGKILGNYFGDAAVLHAAIFCSSVAIFGEC